MIIRMIVAELIDISAHDRMGERVARTRHFPASVQERMSALRSFDRIHHDREISAGRILHSCRNTYSGCHETMLLVLG